MASTAPKPLPRSVSSNDPKQEKPKPKNTSASEQHAVISEVPGPATPKNPNERRPTQERFKDATANKVLQVLTPTNPSDPELHPEFLDLHIAGNRQDHNCHEYDEHTCLIIRRGQKFKLSLTFDRPYDKAKDSVVLQFIYGQNPQESKGTVLRIPIIDKAPSHPCPAMWSAYVSGTEKNAIHCVVTPGAEVIVGRYRTMVETSIMVAEKKFMDRKDFENGTFILLFNPWCKEDQVYMENAQEREEYVMNQHTIVYIGCKSSIRPKDWDLAQFDEGECLDSALYLLDKSGLAATACANPIRVVRTMSAMANCSDNDGGVLTGRWTDEFPEWCTEPWEWNSSAAILTEFLKTKRAVEYGQCWVFSALVTTLLRTLGIPTRSVTNFESAHDCDGTSTIDYHWDEDGKPISHMNDSVWNFHVWNESWFKRPDILKGYDGWQAHDATPQESSEGMMRCGPAPVKAIKEGNTFLKYDAPFIFAEVNADKVHWRVTNDGPNQLWGKQKGVVGCHISTKAVGSRERNDITSEYKYPTNSPEAREAVKRAYGFSMNKCGDIYDMEEPDVQFKLTAPDTVQMGQDFTFTVTMKNISDEKEKRSVALHLHTVVSQSTGKPGAELSDKTFLDVLEPGQELVKRVIICFDDIKDKLKRKSQCTVYMCARVIETGRAYTEIDSFSIDKPELKLETSPNEVRQGNKFQLKVTVTNPLTYAISGGRLHIDGHGIAKGLTIGELGSIEPGQTSCHTFDLTARKAGPKDITACYGCHQLDGLFGCKQLMVKEK